MVKNKFAVMTLTSLALTLNAGVVRAEDDAMFSMDDGFSADSIFDVGTEQNAQQNNAGAEAVKAPVKENKTEPAVADKNAEVDPFAAMSASLEAGADTEDKPADKVAVEEDKKPATAAEAPAVDNIDDMDVFSQMQNNQKAEATAPVSERVLGSADTAVFREMAAIERETALLELKAKREKLLSEIENSKASLRRNQLEELERREQITRNRINWEVEQEQAAKRSALEIEQAKREMERQAKLEEEQRADRERQRQREEEEARRQREMPEVNNNVANSNVSGMPEEDISTVYSIEEVHGVGGELSATLVSSNGTINVREGYPLKNGYKVSKITTSFVEVKKNDKVELLRFANGSNMSR